jgi:hypothetical protein
VTPQPRATLYQNLDRTEWRRNQGLGLRNLRP